MVAGCLPTACCTPSRPPSSAHSERSSPVHRRWAHGPERPRQVELTRVKGVDEVFLRPPPLYVGTGWLLSI